MSEWTFESNRGVFSFFFFKKNFYWSIVVLQCCVSFYYSKVNQPYIYVCMHAQCLSRVWVRATPWTVAHQAPLSLGFSRQEYWSGLPLPFPGDLPDTEIEPMSPALQKDSWPLSHWGSVTSVLHFLHIQVTSEYWAQFPVLYTGFSLVVSVLYIQCVCVSSPTSQFISAPLPRLVSIHFCFMSLSLFCFASRFICTIFLNSTYMHRSVFSVGKFLCFRTCDVKLWNMKAQRDKVTFYQSQ